MRHIASAGREYDKKNDFISPDQRGGTTRTAAHRYLPETMRRSLGGGRGLQHHPDADAPHLETMEYKARWWPTPDAGE